MFSFEGVGLFTDGKLNMGPFTMLQNGNTPKFYSKMINGRPADSSYITLFHPPLTKLNLDSLNKLSNVEGM